MSLVTNRIFRRHPWTCLALGLVLASAGCESAPKLSKTQKGAIVGGLAGAAAGRAIGGHEHAAGGIAIGAVTGAVAGGLIGRYLDQQAQEIDAIPDANVERAEDRLIVTFAGDLLFASGSSSLSPGAQQRLAQLGQTLVRYPKSRMVVKGHTDSVGSESFNLDLSEQRANNVKNYLIAQGVSAARITSLGFGEQFPMAGNETEAGRQQNRRVEIEIVPIEEELRESDTAGGAY
jgi:outer membrane protein OmpA-like peptidoglycan-associated protein